MPVSADNFGMAQIQSMDAVQAWIININSNLGGSATNGYKTLRIKLGGSNAVVTSTSGPALTPLQQGEATFTVTTTAGDFSQGQIHPSASNTDFALQDLPGTAGATFFVVREPRYDPNVTANNAGTIGLHYKHYLTRDGQFHWTPASMPGNVNQTRPVSIPPQSNDANQGYVLVNNYGLVVVNQDGNPLFSDKTDYVSGADALDIAIGGNTPGSGTRPIAVRIKEPQNLNYSRYGSSIFDFQLGMVTANSQLSKPDDVSQDRPIYSQSPALTKRLNSSLESSGSSVTLLIPELTLAQKTFTALAKTLTVSTENMDTVFGFIR